VVQVEIERDAAGRIRAFAARGHAGAGLAGADPVCAGVSALVQSAALGLERRLGLQLEILAGAGLFSCRLGADLDAQAALRAQDILETMRLGLAEIQAQAPRRLRLRERAAN